eukprot:319583_1
MVWDVSVLPVGICSIIMVLMLVIVIRSCKYLLCKKTLVVENKHVYVNVIYKKNKNKIRKKQVTISYSPYIRYATITSLTLYFISISLVLYVMIDMITTSTSHRPLQVIACSLWFIARILMNSIFVERLKSSFYGTKWIINNTWFTYLYILLSLIASLGILGIVFAILQGIVFDEIVVLCGMINFSLMCILDVTCSIILTILFQRKIFELIASYFNIFKNRMESENMREKLERSNLMQLNVENKEDESSNTTQSVPSCASISYTNEVKSPVRKQHKTHKIDKNGFGQHLISDSIVLDDTKEIDEIDDHEKSNSNKILQVYDHKRLELINNITQYMVLIFVSLITSLFTICVGGTIIVQSDTENKMNAWFYLLFTLSIDDFMNALCLYLHYPFSLKLYKCMCGHKLC